jgi:hypothetical protein
VRGILHLLAAGEVCRSRQLPGTMIRHGGAASCSPRALRVAVIGAAFW